MLYTSTDLFIAEIISVIAAFLHYQLLSKRKRVSWIYYIISSVALVYIFYFKASWMSFFNQGMMGILGVKNFYLFYKPNDKWHDILHKLAFGVFILSLPFVQGWDGKSLSELFLWIIIIAKTLYLGKQDIKGWYLQVLQQLVSIIFGWYQGIYFYMLKSAVFAIQAIIGVLSWKRGLKNKF